MGTTIEHFLKTGQLGPISLGMDPTEVETTLGEPQARSHKLNPLILRYSSLELTFWSSSAKRLPPQLVQINLSYQPGTEPLPAPIVFTDWNPDHAISPEAFTSFLRSINEPPIRTIEGERDAQITMSSGVCISFSEGKLTRIQFSRRENDENRPLPLTDEREPSIQQIQVRIDEARKLSEMGFLAPSLVLAWAALEASLRRAALSVGLKGKIGVQPSMLVRELFASHLLNSEQAAFLERTRQLRTAIVHGLAPPPVSLSVVARIIQLAEQLIGSSSPDSSR